MYTTLLILGLLATTPDGCGTGAVTVRGHVYETRGGALAGATIALRGDASVASSGTDGDFELCVTAREGGVLIVTRRGYQALEVPLALDRDGADELRLEMQPMGYFETVEVTSQRSLPEQQALADSLQLSGLDVLRTAGTYADVFRRAQMLPGVSKVDEGAGLFVRGGDVDETVTYLDRALLSHPYRLETPNGGFFGTVPPWLIAGLSLTAGGFPARYGNALSGVLELEGLPRPEHSEVTLTAGLAAVSGQLALPLGEAAGLRLSGNRSQTRTLFELNGVDQEYSTYPQASDLNLGLYLETDRLGRLEAFAFDQRNRVGLEIETESFRGQLSSDDDNRGFGVSWQRAWKACCVGTLTASTSDYRQRSRTGVLDLIERERGERLRFDFDAQAGRWTLRTGAEWERSRIRFAGEAPERGGDLDGLAGTRLWQLDFTSRRAGAWVEVERAVGRFGANFGLRADDYSAQGARVDPRLAVTWTPRPGHRLRLASGIYSQAPQPQYLDPDFGEPSLPLMRARHLILGYAYQEPTDPVHLRLEIYRKDYDHLPLEVEDPDGAIGFSDDGSGWARGADLLITARRGRWSGWMSAGTITARRRSTRWLDAGRLPVPERPVPSGLATPYSLQLSSDWVLPRGFSLGSSFRWSAGRPFTPIVGGTPVKEQDDYLPIYGAIASERYPDYRRLDLTATKSLPFWDSGLAVLYLGISNVFDRQSTFRYAYSPDYSSRRPVRTSFGRSFYAGITLIR